MRALIRELLLYLDHQKAPTPRTLQQSYGPVVVLGEGGFLMSEVPTVTYLGRGSTFALRRPTLDVCLGGQRSEQLAQVTGVQGYLTDKNPPPPRTLL